MSKRVQIDVAAVVVVLVTVSLGVSWARGPAGVSPGAVDRVAEIEGRCPTFSWEGDPGAALFELVAYRLPEGLDPVLYPFALIIPLQLLAYHVSVLRGIDPDRPRNLAKSVTVE